MYQYTCDSKYCATCSCWSGERKICDHFGSRLEVSSPMGCRTWNSYDVNFKEEYAANIQSVIKCMNQKSGAWQQTRQANGGCSAFVKWGALR